MPPRSRAGGAPAFDALHEIALLIAAETELERVLDRVLGAAQTLMGASSASVFLRGADGRPGRRYTTLHTGEPHWEEVPVEVRPGGMTDRTLREGRSVAIEAVGRMPDPSPRLQLRPNQAVLTAPLRWQSDAIGVLYANFEGPRLFTDAERSLVETLGAHAATAVRNAELIAAERRNAAIHRELLEMARVASSSLGMPSVTKLLCQHARRMLGADDVSLLRLRPDGLVQAVASDEADRSVRRVLEPWTPGSFMRSVIEGGAPRCVERPLDRPETTAVVRPVLVGVELCLMAPVLADGECLGLLSALWRRPHACDADELGLAEMIARQAALAVQSQRALEAARLEGAIKTAQAAAHELSQPLAVVVGYSELLGKMDDPAEMRRFAGLIDKAADTATAKLDQFRNVMRFVELRFGSLEPILDVEASSETEKAG